MAEDPDDEFEGGGTIIQGARLTMDEKSLILEYRFKDRMTTKDIAYKLGRSRKTVEKFLNSMSDSTPLAQAMIRANAHKLVKRVLDKADVDQAIDILSRPNVGVLKPIQKQAEGPQIMISVNQDSLGGVAAVGIGLSEPPLPLAGSDARLIGTGRGHGIPEGAAQGPEEPADGGESVQSGHEVSSEAGGGLRVAPDESRSPQGPVGVPRNREDAGPVRPRRVKEVGKDVTRAAIVNPRRLRSSINLKYDIEQ